MKTKLVVSKKFLCLITCFLDFRYKQKVSKLFSYSSSLYKNDNSKKYFYIFFKYSIVCNFWIFFSFYSYIKFKDSKMLILLELFKKFGSYFRFGYRYFLLTKIPNIIDYNEFTLRTNVFYLFALGKYIEYFRLFKYNEYIRTQRALDLKRLRMIFLVPGFVIENN